MPLELPAKIKALLVRAKRIADNVSLLPDERDKQLFALVDDFIAEGKSTQNEAQAFLGCMVKAEVMDYCASKRENPEVLFWPAHRPKEPRFDPSLMNEYDGVLLLLQDCLRTKYQPEDAACLYRYVARVLGDDGVQKHLLQEMQRATVNPFASIRVACVGGEGWLKERLPLKRVFGQFEEFNTTRKLGFSSFDSSPDVLSNHFDYVLTTNVLDSIHHFKGNLQYALGEIFCASAQLLKENGKAIHIASYTGPQKLFYDPGLHNLAGVKERNHVRAGGTGVWTFEKVNTTPSGPETLRVFLRQCHDVDLPSPKEPGRLRRLLSGWHRSEPISSR